MSIVTSITLDGFGIEDETVQGVTITYGRQTVTDEMQASTATITILTPAFPWSFHIGSEVIIDATYDTAPQRRFTGSVVQINGSKYTTTLTCTSAAFGGCAAAQAGELRFDDISPAGTGFYEVFAEILRNAGLVDGYGNFQIGLTAMPGTTVPISPLFIQEGSVLRQLQDIAALDVQGILQEDRGGSIVFVDVNGRNDLNPIVGIPAAAVSDSWVTSQSVSTVINRATITYNNSMNQLVLDDPVSQTDYGVRSYQETFDVVDVDDATLRASKIVAGYSQPTWATNPITVEVTLMDPVDADVLMSLAPGMPIDMSEIAAIVETVPPVAFLEGMTETITQTRYTVDFYVSDPRITRTPQSWSTVTPTLTWASVTPSTLTWTEAIGETL